MNATRIGESGETGNEYLGAAQCTRARSADSLHGVPDTVPNFHLLERLSAGRFGEVWLAEESLTAVRRAIKFVDKQAMRGGQDLAGVRAYQHCAGDCPHLLRILAVGETERNYFYVMELADQVPRPDRSATQSVTLRSVLQRRGALPPGEALSRVADLLRALSWLHRAGLRHNDVKPENIFFVGGRMTLGDPGLVASADAECRAGTPTYAPPDTQRPDDLYATGIVLYELATGLTAAEFPRLPVGLLRNRTAELAPIVRLFNRGGDPRAARRFQNVSEFSAAVEAARRAGRGEVLRRRMGLGLLFVLLLAVAAVLANKAGVLAEIQFRRGGEFYTYLDLLASRVQTVGSGAAARVVVDVEFELRAATGHRIVVAVALDSRPSTACVLYEGTPGQSGLWRRARAELHYPGVWSYDVRLYVSHVLGAAEFRQDLDSRNAPYIRIGEASRAR